MEADRSQSQDGPVDRHERGTQDLAIVGEAHELLTLRSKIRRIDDDRVFPAGARAKQKDAVTDLRAPWEAAIKAAEITDFRWHDLRHTCASYMAMSGVSQAEMAKLLGHKTLAMTMRYAHLSPQRTMEVANGLAKRLGI